MAPSGPAKSNSASPNVTTWRDAKPLGNHTQCPSYGTELPKWSGTHAIDDDEPYSPLSTTKGTISTNLSHTTPSTVNQSFAKHDD